MLGDDRGLRYGSVLLLMGGFVISGYYRHRAEREGGPLPERPEGVPSAVARLVGAVLVASLVGFQAMAPHRVAWSLMPMPAAIRWIGFGAMVAAMPICWWTMRSIGPNVSPSISQRIGARLVTVGPYRWVRHPMYAIGLTMFFGTGVALRSWPVLVLSLLTAWWIPRRIRLEEANLQASFGDAYRDYVARTGRLVPRMG